MSPGTGAPLKVVEKAQLGDDIREGVLICEETGQEFPIRGGVPYFSPQAASMNATARRFGYQWKRQAAGAFEKERIYGQSADEELEGFLHAMDLVVKDLSGLQIADVGCGRGRLSRKLAEHGAHVVAADISSSIEQVQAEGAHIPNLHAIQADLFYLPLRDRSLDVIWSDGVIHHTPDPRMAFSALAAKVADGGRLGIYVYPQVRSIYKQVRRWTPAVYQWPIPILQAYCSIMAMVIYLARIVVGKRQPYREVSFRLFDTLACPYLSMHSPNEVISWFEENQFHQVRITEPHITAMGIKKPVR